MSDITYNLEVCKQVVLDTIQFGAKIKKTPVVVGNCTGFAVNRVFFPYTQAACLLVDIGLDPYMIDKVISLGFGMPMGPFRCRQLIYKAQIISPPPDLGLRSALLFQKYSLPFKQDPRFRTMVCNTWETSGSGLQAASCLNIEGRLRFGQDGLSCIMSVSKRH